MCNAQFTNDSDAVPVVNSYSTDEVNLAASTNDQIIVVNPGSGKAIWVYGLTMAAGAADGTILLHTSSSLTGTMPIANKTSITINPSGNFAMPWLKVPSNNALLGSTGACTIDGLISYAVVSE